MQSAKGPDAVWLACYWPGGNGMSADEFADFSVGGHPSVLMEGSDESRSE